MLYEMLAGHAAFPGRSSAERLAAILARDPDPLPADLSPGLARVVLRALERDAGRRFPTARAFLGDLYKVTSGEVVALGAGVVPNGFESLAEIHTHR